MYLTVFGVTKTIFISTMQGVDDNTSKFQEYF